MKSEMTECPMPFCRHCGLPLRQKLPPAYSYIPNKPWNYLWNGKCERCGCTYNIYSEQSIDECRKKILSVVASRRLFTSPFFSLDTFCVLSGVTIESTIVENNLCTDCHEVFLGSSELRYIRDVVCGHSFYCTDLSFKTPIDDNQERTVSIKYDSWWIDTPSSSCDTDAFLCGFTVSTLLTSPRFGSVDCESVFLSMSELKYIIDELKDSPLLQQKNYYMDDT